MDNLQELISWYDLFKFGAIHFKENFKKIEDYDKDLIGEIIDLIAGGEPTGKRIKGLCDVLMEGTERGRCPLGKAIVGLIVEHEGIVSGVAFFNEHFINTTLFYDLIEVRGLINSN